MLDLETTSVATDYIANTLNQYTSIGGVTQSHDPNGNLVDDGTHTYTFDAENRLASAVLDDGSGGTLNAGYTYDPFMRRVSKTIDGETTLFVWSGQQLVSEYDGSGTRTRRYLYARNFGPILVQDPGDGGGEVLYRVHADHLDTPRRLTDSVGSVVWEVQLSAFGVGSIDDNPDGDATATTFHPRFPGQYLDEESGLHYNRFRYYAPKVGGYASRDPVPQLIDTNRYRYVAHNPANWVDPLGLMLGAVAGNVARALATVTGQTATEARAVGAIGAAGVGFANDVSSSLSGDPSIGETVADAAGLPEPAGATIDAGLSLAGAAGALDIATGALATAAAGGTFAAIVAPVATGAFGFEFGNFAMNLLFASTGIDLGTLLGDSLFDFLNPPDHARTGCD